MKTTNFALVKKLTFLLFAAALVLAAAPLARADEEKDPPKLVARISYVDGSVSLQPGGQGDWGSAPRNRPVTIGDKIWVDKDSRAELQAGAAAFHLGSMTALSFLNLDEAILQVRLPEGSLNFRVRELRQGDIYEIDTPNAAFTVKQAGDFRIDVNEAGDSSRITALRGEGQISAGGQNYDVHAGDQAEFNGAENPTYSITRATAPDGLDRWAEERDLKEDRSVSGNYVSRDMPGYDDLDDYGTWRDEPEYGHVWYPSAMPPDWAPYSYGNWSWVGPWGWTWVDYSPWGFAPYHYGRWAFIGGAWGWCPGPFFGPPVYGPAFVGFFGGGWGFGVGLGVGWFPLGWGEPFFPWFHCSRGFVNVINVHNTFIRNVNILNGNGRNFNFVNAHNLRAVTTTSRNGFVNGERVNRGTQHLTQASLNGARFNNSVGLRPTQHSSLGAANVNAHAARPSAAIQNRSVMARTAPAAGAHSPVRTMTGSESASARMGNSRATANAGANARTGNSSVSGSARAGAGIENRSGNASANSGMTARQRELSQNRPPSAAPNANRSGNTPSGMSSQRPGNNSRVWEAQSNSSDRGRAPQGFGSDRPANVPAQNSPRATNDRPAQGSSGASRPGNAPSQNSPRASADRPPWAGSGASGAPRGGNAAPNYNINRPSNSNGGRSYEPPQRNSNGPSRDNRGYAPQPNYSPRTYSSPGRSYPAPSRSYSPPSRSYSAPSRSYSAPSHNSGGGGNYGGSRGGGGSHSSGGGGGSHSSGGGGGSHGGGHPHR